MIMKNNFLKNSIIAHRGIYDNKKVVENTLEAFKKAINKGYAIELDLRITKDNKVVVFHDDTLDRLSSKKGKIEDLTLDEIKNIQLINKASIPTFEEVLELVNGKVPLLIELKSNKGFTLERETIKTLNNYGGEYAIQSFNPKTIIWLRLFKNNITRGLLVSPKTTKFLKLISLCKPDFINVNKVLLDNDVVKNFNKTKLAYVIKKDEKSKYNDKCDNMICNM